MIYVGLINFDHIPSHKAQELIESLSPYTETPPTCIRKENLTLCYGKLSELQDKDDIWENDFSIILGRFFNKTEKRALGKEEFKALFSLDKEDFLKKFWGKYVWIQSHEKGTHFEIVIDSTGQLPFFFYPFSNGNILFASHIDIIFKILAQKPEFNWTYLCSYLIYGNSSAVQTPFQKIHELPPACSLKIRKNQWAIEPFWNPLTSYNPLCSQREDAVSILQSTLKPWIAPYKNICVSLSGGLDSSSLVYCLKDIVNENQKLNAINYFHSQIKSSNELVHAQKVCHEAGINLIEMDASTFLPFTPSKHSSTFKPNKPFPGLISLSCLESTKTYLPSKESCTFISGHGSDHIFMCPPTKKSLADYILEMGFKGSKEKIKEITTYYRDPLSPILKKTILSLANYILSRRLEKRHPKNTEDESPKWFKPELYRETADDFVHPIYGTLSKKILPGKYDQVDAFYEGLASIHMEMNSIHPTYYPFLYPPVVDFALSYPTYRLFEKGYDRYPLRKAVSDHFKTQTVWRRDKSQTTGIFQLGVKKNIAYVQDLCLEGHLVKESFVDKEELEKTITLISNGDINHMWPFVHLASTELFLRFWEGKST